MTKTCNKCNENKKLNAFYKRKSSKDGYRNCCKSCKLLQDKKNYEDNRTIRLEKQRRYKEPKRKEFAEKQRLYYSLHRKERIAYETNRLKNDADYRLKNNLRCRLSSFFRQQRKKRYDSCSAVRDLGCTIIELKQHLETQFQPGMSWENKGKKGWHIDHIKPLSSFDLSNSEEFKKAVHFTNLQPLWAHDNYVKGKFFKE